MASISLSRRKGTRDPRHLMRYLKAKAGIDPKEIARSEHVSLRRVQDSIKDIEAYEHQNDEGQLQLAVRDLVISVIPTAKNTINGLLTATTTVRTPNSKTGKVDTYREEDKTTRLEAARLVKDLVIGMQPKQPAVAVNVNQTNQTANIGTAETLEERMRRLRSKAQAHNLLAPEVAAVPASIDQKIQDDDGYDGDDEDGDEEE